MRNVALALSFAHLVYLRIWFDLLSAPAERSHLKYTASRNDYLALLCNVAIVGLGAWVAMCFWGSPRRWQRTLLVVCGMGLVGNAVRAVLSAYVPLLRSGAFQIASPKWILLTAALAGCVGVFVLFRYLPRATRIFRGLLLVCLPIVPLADISAVWRIVAPPPKAAAESLLARPAPRQPRDDVRVIWVIFDEWDNRLSFVQRPKGVRLPALDALVARSLVGTRVLGPQGRMPVGGMATQVAIPSLLAGEVRGADRFARPNLFALAHDRGWNVAVGGWYIPYCRTFASDVFRCYWDQMYTQANTYGESVTEAVGIQSRSLFETSMFSLLGQSLSSKRHAAEYRALLDFALGEASDAKAGLVFLHFNIPHAPYFYDAGSNRYNATGRTVATAYGDALMLVDQTVAKLEARLDSKTVLILSADHPLRVAEQVDGASDPHVPFLLHWPGQTRPLREPREFSSLRTAALILEILDGKVRTIEEADRFLTGSSGAQVVTTRP